MRMLYATFATMLVLLYSGVLPMISGYTYSPYVSEEGR